MTHLNNGGKDLEREKQIEEGAKMAAAEGGGAVEKIASQLTRVASDEPKTMEQLKAEGKSEYLVTPAAHKYLRDHGFDDMRRSTFNRDLREIVIRRRVDNLKRQLTLAETTAAVQFLREKRQSDFTAQQDRSKQYKEALNLRLDEASPNKEGETCVANVSKTCENTFKPMARYLVSGVKRVSERGQEVELGNYLVTRVNEKGLVSTKEGELAAIGICKECAQHEQFRGVRLITWQGAEAKIATIKAEAEAEQDRSRRAEFLRQSLVTPEGGHRFNSGNASRDINETARHLESRRGKRNFQGRR